MVMFVDDLAEFGLVLTLLFLANMRGQEKLQLKTELDRHKWRGCIVLGPS